MYFPWKCCSLVQPRCKLIVSKSLIARISTAVTKQKSEESQPYPFMSKMRENKHRVADTFKAPETDRWKYQPFIMLGCTAIFLFYFCIWRDEHDVDIAISKYMYQAIPGLEEQDLRRSIAKAKKRGQDTLLYEKRLEELLAQKSH